MIPKNRRIAVRLKLVVSVYLFSRLQEPGRERSRRIVSMTLFFNRQSVRITGKKLRELVSALQRMAVEWVKEQSEHFDSIGTSDGAWVESIQIVEKTPSLKADGKD
jgi:hypothetical protein